jgi:hypothetical protein
MVYLFYFMLGLLGSFQSQVWFRSLGMKNSDFLDIVIWASHKRSYWITRVDIISIVLLLLLLEFHNIVFNKLIYRWQKFK